MVEYVRSKENGLYFPVTPILEKRLGHEFDDRLYTEEDIAHAKESEAKKTEVLIDAPTLTEEEGKVDEEAKKETDKKGKK